MEIIQFTQKFALFLLEKFEHKNSLLQQTTARSKVDIFQEFYFSEPLACKVWYVSIRSMLVIYVKKTKNVFFWQEWMREVVARADDEGNNHTIELKEYFLPSSIWKFTC